MESSSRNALLIAALVILVIAITLRLVAGGTSLAEEVTAELKKHGCMISSDELYQQSYAKASSIAEIMTGIDLEDAIAASQRAGFPSDTERQGEIYLLLAKLDDEHVLTVFVVDEAVELAFIQILGSDEVKAVNEL